MIELVIVEIKIPEISVHANKQSLLLLHLKRPAATQKRRV
jgi:hypothetical protein